ncbi:histidine--tRNA ligase [Candidatus Daviesbacteria bacterium]|nr:histidine--tRNA ligase [Candidatus Daviesbacteria bacterium]
MHFTGGRHRGKMHLKLRRETLKMKLQTPKGFRDFLAADSLKRKFVVDKIIKVFERFGFDPLETPTLEFAQTLKGKYGEEEKLIYEFKTKGGDEVALRYDLTVPLARVVAQYGPGGQQLLPIPYKRYQIQPAFRGENTQKGRYREFLQCDADIVGASSVLADAEILAIIFEIYKDLGLEVSIKINDRTLFGDLEPKYLNAIDKLLKIGEQGVLAELEKKGMSKNLAQNTLEKFRTLKPSENLQKVMEAFEGMGYLKDSLVFDPTLVRGLDYYTGLIVEAVLKSDPNSSSLCGGGRYDRLIGKFSGTEQSAVGFSVGLDRTLEALQDSGVLKPNQTLTKVLVTIFSTNLMKDSLKAASTLRSYGIYCELWLDPESKLDRQLKYANQKSIPFAIIIGPEEKEQNLISLKDLTLGTQQQLTLDQLLQKLK